MSTVRKCLHISGYDCHVHNLINDSNTDCLQLNRPFCLVSSCSKSAIIFEISTQITRLFVLERKACM